MKIETQKFPAFNLITINKPKTDMMVLMITVDFHRHATSTNIALSALYGDLLLSGAGRYDREQFTRALDEIGSSIKVGASDGRVTISVTCLSDKLGKTMTLLKTMLTSPNFKPAELKRAKETLENFLEQYKENARALAFDGLRSALYQEGDRHFAYPPQKIKLDLKKITPKDIKSFHDQIMDLYWAVTIGGDQKSLETVLTTINKLKATQLAAEPQLVTKATNPVAKNQLITEEVPSKQNIEFSIGGHLPLKRSDDNLPAFIFGLNVLGKWGGFAGRLMSTVREKEGLTYGIYAGLEGITTSETGFWRIMTFFSPKDAATGLKSTKREIKKIHDHGITDNELERFRTILKTGDQLVYDSLSKMTGLVHSVQVSGVDYEDYAKFREKLYQVTKEEVNQALKTYLNPKKLIISAAGPVKGVERELKTASK